MKAINGVKVFKTGDVDCMYAENSDKAQHEFEEMIGVETAADVLENDPCIEMSQKDFDSGQLHYDVSGKLEGPDSPLISYKEALLDLTKNGSKSGHFSTSEY